MGDEEYGYKVIRKYSNALMSAVVIGNASVRYAVGEWARPPDWLARRGYYLTYFDEVGAATKFADSCDLCLGDVIVYRCAASGTLVGELPRVLYPPALAMGRMEMQAWEGAIVSKVRTPPVWPKGTRMAAAIKLLRKV